MQKVWKNALLFVLLATLLLSVVACGDKKSENENVVVVYSPNSEGLMEATISAFEEETGIKVVLQQAGTGELLAKLRGESADPVADIMYGGNYTQYEQNHDLFAAYTSANADNIGEGFASDKDYITGFTLNGSCLILNKTLVEEMGLEIKGYADLLNPELRGKIACGDPANSSSAFQQLSNMLLAMGGYESEEAWQYVHDLFDNIDGKIQSSSSNVYKMVADGEMVVGLSYEDPVMTLIQDGGDVDIVFPEEGTVFLPAGTAIIKDCKHRENAEKFIDFVTSEAFQNKLGLETTVRPIMSTAKMSEFMVPFEDIYLIYEDMDYVNSHKEELVNKWKDVFAEVSSN